MDGRQLAGSDLGSGLQSRVPRERVAIEDWRADRRRAKRLASVGCQKRRGGAELVKRFVVGGEADNRLQSLTHSAEGTVGRVQRQRVPDDVERVLRHVGEDIEQVLTVGGEVGEQRVLVGGVGERVALEQDVQQHDSNRPDIGSGRRITIAVDRRVVLFRCHVAVGADSKLGGPKLGGSQAKVTNLHGTVGCQENVLRLEVAVVDTIGVEVFNAIDQLQHEVADVLGLERALFGADGFVEVAIAAQFDDNVLVVLGLESVNQIDDVLVVRKLAVDLQLLRVVVDGVGRRASRLLFSARLGDALDGDVFFGESVPGLEDQAE